MAKEGHSWSGIAESCGSSMRGATREWCSRHFKKSYPLRVRQARTQTPSVQKKVSAVGVPGLQVGWRARAAGSSSNSGGMAGSGGLRVTNDVVLRSSVSQD